MKTDAIKKTLAGIAVASTLGSGSVVIDNATVTDAEIRSSIESAVEQGKVPAVDLKKVSLDRMAEGYVDVALEHGIVLDDSASSNNVYDLIRERKREQGERLAPKSEETLIVK